MARRNGYVVRKSRRAPGSYVDYVTNCGEFMLVDASRNFPVLGFHYDATLDDIEEWLNT